MAAIKDISITTGSSTFNFDDSAILSRLDSIRDRMNYTYKPVLKDYDDDICYGYCGRSDCAMFKDFKQLIKDGADTEMGIEWY